MFCFYVRAPYNTFQTSFTHDAKLSILKFILVFNSRINSTDVNSRLKITLHKTKVQEDTSMLRVNAYDLVINAYFAPSLSKLFYVFAI